MKASAGFGPEGMPIGEESEILSFHSTNPFPVRDERQRDLRASYDYDLLRWILAQVRWFGKLPIWHLLRPDVEVIWQDKASASSKWFRTNNLWFCFQKLLYYVCHERLSRKN
jgi:hypothetical protein